MPLLWLACGACSGFVGLARIPGIACADQADLKLKVCLPPPAKSWDQTRVLRRVYPFLLMLTLTWISGQEYSQLWDLWEITHPVGS